jgi:hypothetical protein
MLSFVKYRDEGPMCVMVCMDCRAVWLDSDRWELMASVPVVLPSLSQGIFVGKLRSRNKLDIPQEILVEPTGIGLPGHTWL